MTYVLLSGAAVEPLTLADVKAHLRIEDASEEGYLTSLIRTARDHLERATGLLPITQSWRLHLDSVHEDGVIHILRGPVQHLDAIRFYDADGNPQVYPVAGVAVEAACVPSRVKTVPGALASLAVNGVDLDFTAGFGVTGNEVPDSLKRAMLIHVAQMFELRGAVSASDQPAVLPDGYDRLIDPFRRRGL